MLTEKLSKKKLDKETTIYIIELLGTLPTIPAIYILLTVIYNDRSFFSVIFALFNEELVLLGPRMLFYLGGLFICPIILITSTLRYLSKGSFVDILVFLIGLLCFVPIYGLIFADIIWFESILVAGSTSILVLTLTIIIYLRTIIRLVDNGLFIGLQLIIFR